jgi:hypothetical protein
MDHTLIFRDQCCKSFVVALLALEYLTFLVMGWGHAALFFTCRTIAGQYSFVLFAAFGARLLLHRAAFELAMSKYLQLERLRI